MEVAHLQQVKLLLALLLKKYTTETMSGGWFHSYEKTDFTCVPGLKMLMARKLQTFPVYPPVTSSMN
jgi:hypothetical protein